MKTIHNVRSSFYNTKWQQIISVTAIVAIAAVLFVGVGSTWARPRYATAPTLGTAGSFAVLAGSAATNTGPTTLVGDLGVSPGTAISGFPPGIVTGGSTQSGNAVALQAQNDVITAYNNLAGQPCTADLTDQDLGQRTLTPGVYCFPNTSAQLTGALTLDGQGDPGAVFIFKIGSTLTTASNSSVLTINGAADCNVFWQVGSSATLGTGTSFVGNILALTSITLNTNTTLFGRALARNGAVTMDSNQISTICNVASPTNTPSSPSGTATPGGTPGSPGGTATPGGTPGSPGGTPGSPGGTATPIGTPGSPGGTPGSPGGTATPIIPIGASTPTALEPIGQPSGQPKASSLTIYIPFGAK